ncbi:MAG TPA: hypothetical protein PKM59_02490, partial [Thermodesulfobacteriota bacterium]|nr:hypothetical protein [Thermodesulfobacteriota bacterium]
MNDDFGKLVAQLEADHSRMDRQLNEAERSMTAYTHHIDADIRTTERNWQRLGSVMQSAFNVAAVAAVAATAGIGYAITQSIKGASDLNETLNKSAVVFGQQHQAMLEWAKDSATTMGLSRQAALDYSSSLGDLFKQLGSGVASAAKMSQGLVELSADIASFKNVAGGAAQVLQDMQSAFRGEFDPIQKYIPMLTAATIQQEAMAETGKRSADSLTMLEKAAATYSLMLKHTTDSQGDFLKTSGGYANQMRILKEQIKDTSDTIGDAFLPIVTDGLQDLNKYLDELQKSGQLEEWGKKAEAAFDTAGKAIGFVVDELGDVFSAAVDITKVFASLPEGAISYFEELEKAAKGASEEIAKVKPLEETEWQKTKAFMADWGDDIIDAFVFMGKTAGESFALIISQAFSAVKVIGQQFYNLGGLIGAALNPNLKDGVEGMKYYWNAIVNASFDFEREIQTSWNVFADDMGKSWDDLTRGWLEIPDIAKPTKEAFEKAVIASNVAIEKMSRKSWSTLTAEWANVPGIIGPTVKAFEELNRAGNDAGSGVKDGLGEASKELIAYAEKLKDAIDPMQKYNDELKKLDEALKYGLVTPEQYAKQLSHIGYEYQQATSSGKDFFDTTSDALAAQIQLWNERDEALQDYTRWFSDEAAYTVEVWAESCNDIEDINEDTWEQCGEAFGDFAARLIGEGEDLATFMSQIGKRITGGFAADMANIGFNLAMGLPVPSTPTAAMLDAGLTAISAGKGALGGIPGLPSIASSAMSFLGMGATTAALDASSIATLAMAGVIDPATAQMMMAELAPTATGFGAQSMQFLNSYGIYGAAGSIGYSLLAQPLGLPYNEPALAGIGAGAGAMIGQALIPIPGLGAVIGATLGGIFGGSLGGADHEARRDERGATWSTNFAEISGITDLSQLPSMLTSAEHPSGDQYIPGVGYVGLTEAGESQAKVQYAGYEHTYLADQMTKTDYEATLGKYDNLAADVANTLDEQGRATEATAAALGKYGDTIELTAMYMEDWGHDAQAAGQALIAFYGTLSAGAIEDYFSEVYTGAMSLAEAMALLNDMGMTPLEASTAAVAQALSDLLGVTAETSGSITEMYDVLQASLEAQNDYNLYAADMVAIQSALTSGYQFTEEELKILVTYYQMLEDVLSGEIEATEDFFYWQTQANAVIQDSTGYWDNLAASIENARLRLQGFTDLDFSALAMIERYILPDLLATTGPANPDEPSVEMPTGQSILDAYGSPETALQDLAWLPEWFKTASDTDIEWMAQHYYPELEVDAAVQAFTADILWLDEQFKKTAEDQIAIQQQLEDQYTSIANSLQADIMQATLSPQDYARYQLGTSYQGHQAGIDALRAAGVSEEALQPLQDLLDYWYEVQLDAIDKQFMVSEKFGMTISELDSLAGSWQSVLDNIQNTQLSLLTGLANPATAYDRLGIARSAIDEYTGGMSIDAYLAGLSPEEQISATSDLQGLLSDYLSVAQEAYERPSPEYQAIFDEVISGLGTLEDFAVDQLSAIEIDQQQLTTLQSIEAGVWTLAGSGEVKAEATNSTPIVSPESSKSDTGGNVVIEINVTATGSPEDNAKTIVNEVTRWA